jgi:uncharacterized repeat protein (TIGR01451 family)
VTASADVSITKSDGVTNVVAGDGATHTYTITVTNAGPSDAANVSVADTWPSGFTRGTITAPQSVTCAGSPGFTCSLGTVPAGGTVTITVNYTVPATTNASQTNTATVSSQTPDPTAGNNTATDTDTVTFDTPPTANAGPDVSGNEGSAIALHGSVSDPDTGDIATAHWTYTAVSGVDAGATCSFDNANAADTTITCTDDGTYKATLTATDKSGKTTTDDATVTVANVAPTVTAQNATPSPFALGTSVTATVNFTDPGSNDTHTCSINWDDGTTTAGVVVEPSGSNPGTCTATHTYTTAGVNTATFTVTDDDGGSSNATVQFVVYDPSGGFVTGGGWINVVAGSYTADPTLSGRANFGFNSQYKKGATVPTGETEFQFQVGNFDFHSVTYSWLVVSGYKAQYKGTGTVNGTGSYDFTLTAYDGKIGGAGQTGYDRFRIVITNHATGALVFDNRVGASMDMDAANPQNLAGGSITIHKA